ncbi:YqeG family HAD IIIA-type phosphatase [Paenibacillus chartarius]|uniref:YqeG family HAD IIIA-type phosphatase n=1 Tax=Paenibacillus chartarius TaxID=747481 RepID=A0ABV6DT79_9BACL
MLNKLTPRLQVKTIYDIDLNELYKAGIRGIITDLDNTLVGARDPHATPELIGWLELVKQKGFQVVIVSNNHHARVSTFADPLAIPFIPSARKPTNQAFRKALQLMSLKPEQACVIGDQMMTDVLGGNRMGLFTILVKPISLGDEGFFTKAVNRRLEKVALYWMRK